MNRHLFPVALALADDALVLGHRLSQWSSRAPTLEEDIALSNLALDLIGQARLFYQLAGGAEGRGRSEDRLAYFREAGEFRCIHLVELPAGDFAFTMARQLVYAAFMHPYFEALAGVRPHSSGLGAGSAATDARGPTPEAPDDVRGLILLRDIAAKAVKEMAYHVRHAAEWVIRLGDGTEESRRRMILALEEVWPYAAELFEMGDDERALATAGLVPDRAAIRPLWQATIARVLAEATLDEPSDRPAATGGRRGRHTPHLAPMLADMQVLARAHPDATW
jgi:ring-1,2-phenylacetyl-CoA epoxidase subunit PaaC